MKSTDIIIYQTEDGNINIQTRLEDETVWLTLNQISDLFQKTKSTISEHIRNIFNEGELSEIATIRNFRTVQVEGARSVERDLVYYNLDVIISLVKK